jgi:hypothetical protein
MFHSSVQHLSRRPQGRLSVTSRFAMKGSTLVAVTEIGQARALPQQWLLRIAEPLRRLANLTREIVDVFKR